MTTPTGTNGNGITVEPVRFQERAWKVIAASLAVTLVCVSVIAVAITIQANSTQDNADIATQEAQELRAELTCRAKPTLEYDRESSKLDFMIADALGQVALGAFEDPEQFATEINEQVNLVEVKLDAREQSIITCAQD